MRSRFLVVFVLLAALTCSAMAQIGPTGEPENKAQRDARMKWWREAKFGMFIHWGLYAVPAGTWDGKQVGGIGEWIMHNARIPVADYAALAKQFNPVKFNADEWVRTAKEAGMKYIVITSKHHDGFAMFHSAASSYNIYDATPFKRDPLKELSDACKKYRMPLGFYYSEAQDWHHPGGAAVGGHWDPAQDGSMDDYIKNVAIPQVREILSNYGKVSVLWWDTPEGMTRERAAQLAALLKLQPGIVTNDRLGGGLPGDTATPEQWIPASGYPGRDWETCMTINDTWGYKSYDNNWKSTETLIRNLVDIASKGGNYLLNVGPTAEGVFPAPIVERLQAVGKWMKTNGEAIYGTTPSPFRKQLAWGRCTRKGSTLFLHVFNWPADGVVSVPLSNSPVRAYLLADKKKALKAAKSGESIEITLPKTAPDAVATVVALEIKGEPETTVSTIKAKAGESVVLDASSSIINGGTLQLETLGNGRPSLGYWTVLGDYPEWKVDFAAAGTYEVSVTFALAPGSAGSKLELACGVSKLAFSPEATKAWSDFIVRKIGTVKVAAAGVQSVTMKARAKPGEGVVELRTLVLTPVK